MGKLCAVLVIMIKRFDTSDSNLSRNICAFKMPFERAFLVIAPMSLKWA